MFANLIGKRSNTVKNTVERSAVKKFAEAIGDPHPIFIDEELGKRSRYKNNIAPPTFSRVFDYGKVEGLNLPIKGLIHGEQYHYERPLIIGEDVLCYTEVKNYYERSGKLGNMVFSILTVYG
ncbi:hypothetical protein KP78_29200 [Jeotgalibacillus soli]|uniref:FAS1-like dehydratase domain-containing protein n=1 Tax=Jeotgalibacillus soli TaxID=889306 RepID=A0A0C2VLN2_9BACL